MNSISCFRGLVRELLQKPQIILEEQSNVADLVPQHRHALYAEPPCETGDLLRVVSNRLEDRRVHHAAPSELDPAGPLAHLTPLAVALPAADVDLRARLGVRKKAR